MGDNNDGVEVLSLSQPFTMVKKYDGLNITEIKEKFDHLKGDEFEGFVIKFQNNFRMKIKLSNYFILHRLYSGLNEKTLWEMLSKNEPLDLLYQTQEEEVLLWVDNTVNDLNNKYKEIYDECYLVYQQLKSITTTQKEYALQVFEHHCKHKSMLFSLYQGKESKVKEQIWKYLNLLESLKILKECCIFLKRK